MFVFLCERKQGVLTEHKAENCSFVQKRRNFVSNNCINLRGKPYIVFVFLRESKQGVLTQQKAENCSFVQKRRNFVTRLIVVYVVTGHYKVTLPYENKTKT